MSGEYRVTVRGVMSERFCLGFPGHDPPRARRPHRPGGRRPTAARSTDLLAILDNLGSRSSTVEDLAGAAAITHRRTDCHASPVSSPAAPGGSSVSRSHSSFVAVLVGGPLTANLTARASRIPAPSSSPPATSSRPRPAANPSPGLIALVEPAPTSARAPAARPSRRPPRRSPPTPTSPGRDRLQRRRRRPHLDRRHAVVHGRLPQADQRRRGRRTPPCASATSSRASRTSRVGGAVVVGEEAGTIIGEDLAQAPRCSPSR